MKLQGANPEEVKNKGRYQRLVGRLIYLSHTCLDIAFPVSMVSQFMHSPGPIHFDAVYRILRYLKWTLGKGILFHKHDHFQVEVYIDADWEVLLIEDSDYCSFV